MRRNPPALGQQERTQNREGPRGADWKGTDSRASRPDGAACWPLASAVPWVRPLLLLWTRQRGSEGGSQQAARRHSRSGQVPHTEPRVRGLRLSSRCWLVHIFDQKAWQVPTYKARSFRATALVSPLLQNLDRTKTHPNTEHKDTGRSRGVGDTVSESGFPLGAEAVIRHGPRDRRGSEAERTSVEVLGDDTPSQHHPQSPRSSHPAADAACLSPKASRKACGPAATRSPWQPLTPVTS